MSESDLAISGNPDPLVVWTTMPLRVIERLQQFTRAFIPSVAKKS